MQVVPLSTISALVHARPARTAGTKVIAVDGPSGSGKTILAVRLGKTLSAPVLHMDDLYPGWDGLAQAPGLLVDGVLGPLQDGLPASYRRWDWENDRWAETVSVDPGPVLIVEGCGSGALACAPYVSAIVWIEAPRDVRMRRGIERDGEAYRPHWERWAAHEDSMFATDRTRERSDVLIDGDPTIAYDEATEFVSV